MIGCVIFLVVVLVGILHVDHPRSFGLDKETSKFLRNILNEYFTRITGIKDQIKKL